MTNGLNESHDVIVGVDSLNDLQPKDLSQLSPAIRKRFGGETSLRLCAASQNKVVGYRGPGEFVSEVEEMEV